VIGQEAVKAVSSNSALVVRLEELNRPIVFSGPTGVGKTEGPGSLFLLRRSDDPAGYVGIHGAAHGQQADWFSAWMWVTTKAVNLQKQCGVLHTVVLFDEIEKNEDVSTCCCKFWKTVG